jgi:hypothetical protein
VEADVLDLPCSTRVQVPPLYEQQFLKTAISGLIGRHSSMEGKPMLQKAPRRVGKRFYLWSLHVPVCLNAA